MKRFDALLAHLKGYKTLLDVGTDHAKLPVMALNQKRVEKAYASDNKEGPLEAAKKTLEASKDDLNLELLLGDGLDILTHDVDVCVIAGMGGKTIQKILLNADFKNIQRFIIQPTNHLKSVRHLTVLKGLYLSHETLVMEKGIPYITMVFDLGCAPLTEKELYYGTHLIKEKNEDYKRLLENDYAFTKTLLSSIPKDKQSQEMVKKYGYLKEILDDWS